MRRYESSREKAINDFAEGLCVEGDALVLEVGVGVGVGVGWSGEGKGD